MRAGQRLFSLLRENETAQSIAIAMSVAGLVVGLVVLFLEWPVDEYRAITTVNYSKINYGQVTCLSINSQRVTIEGKPYWDPMLAQSMTDILPIKPILLDAAYSECPWEFSADISPGTLIDAYDGLVHVQYLVTAKICRRADDGRSNLSSCLSKSVFVFNWRVKPHDLFRIALVGLRPDTKEDEEFRVKASDD